MDGSLAYVDIVPGSQSSSPTGFTTCGGSSVLFAATTSMAGTELWSSDGTSFNTFLVADICPGGGSSSPDYITCYKGKYFFQADDCVHGRELWVSDGMRNGSTHMVKDIRAGSASSSPSFLTTFTSQLDGDEYLMLIATDGLYTTSMQSSSGYGGSQVWRSDGTAQGTQRATMQTQNDLYIDTKLMEHAYRSALLAYDGMLLLPGSFDDLSRGGGDASSGGMPFGLGQPIAVFDVDTPASDFLTLTITASNGLVLLNASAVISSSADSYPLRLSFLVADPDDIRSVLLMNMLSARGYAVDLATEGLQVLDLTMASHYDCVLIYAAINPSHIDAFETIRIIRERQSTPPYLITYSTDDSLAAALVRGGASQFLRIPALTGSGDRIHFQSFVNAVVDVFLISSPDLVIVSITSPDSNMTVPTNLPGPCATQKQEILYPLQSMSSCRL